MHLEKGPLRAPVTGDIVLTIKQLLLIWAGLSFGSSVSRLHVVLKPASWHHDPQSYR